ncbi:dermonecrotic toxin domain-containing protein [Pseudomonas sp. nanlin1]|uniref:dermonecrotic toxin domain-containing protein n=1 Tax=Pseudomonas sp. nanlin1 TaxID=3040605 RepID=UPI00388E78A9
MTDNLTDLSRQQLLDIAREWVERFPDLHSLAHEQAAALIKRHSGRALDPDKVYWHRFENAISSPRTFSGWQHHGLPQQSMTLLELLLHRFSAHDQDNIDTLQTMGGFYTDGPEHGLYDERNEVRLLPADLLADFWRVDFGDLYHTRLTQFWTRHGGHFVALARATFFAEVRLQRHLLNGAELSLLNSGLANGLSVPLSVDTLSRAAPSAAGASLHTLSIGGLVARDVLRLVDEQGRQVLYLPGDQRSLLGFADHSALYAWVRSQCADPRGLDTLSRHFSAFNALDSEQARQLTQYLEQIRDDASGQHQGLLNQASTLIEGDGFFHLREVARWEMKRQADTLLTTNDQLRRQLWIRYLGAFIGLTNSMAPLGWPAALIVVGASIAHITLCTQTALQTSDRRERRQAILAAIGSAITVLFTAPLIFIKSPGLEEPGLFETLTQDEPPLPAEPVPEQVALLSLERPRPTFVMPEGGYWNSLGLVERCDVKVVYQVRELPRGADPTLPLTEGLRATHTFDYARKMLGGPVLRAFATPRGAVHYAQAAFDGPFVMYELDIDGLPSVSLRENLHCNPRFMATREGYPEDFVEQRLRQGRALDDFANDGWLFDEVHVQGDGLDGSRITLVDPNSLEHLAQALQRWELTPGVSTVLRGVKVREPLHCGATPRYSIEVAGYPQSVRYDPLTNTWRTYPGKAYRLQPETGCFSLLPEVDSEPRPSPAQMDEALQGLGIQVRWPWTLAPLERTAAQPIRRALHFIWIGRQMPKRFVNRVIANATLADSGERPFTSHLYLAINNARSLDKTMLSLAQRPSCLTVHYLQDTAFFEHFQTTPFFEQYQASSTGNALNYASAVDTLRFALLDHEGGLYMDVDDTILPPEPGEPAFGDHAFEVAPGQLLLGNLVRHRRLGMMMDFNTSHFGSLPDNPLLRDISLESFRRFQNNRDLYLNRPFETINSDSEMQAYARRISYVGGPALLNAVVDARLEDFRQFRGLNRMARGELCLPAEEITRIKALVQARNGDYSALGGVIRIGTTASWMHT